jgi:hypothetical protein
MNQVNQDQEHLKILSILFYVKAGLLALTGLFFSIYIFMGVAFISMDIPRKANEPDPAIFGGFFIVFGLVFIVLFGAMAVLAFLAGRNLARYRSYTFCFVIAALVCLSMPLGTLLGIFTIVVLMRDSVKALFNGQNFSQFNNPPSPPNWQ